MNNLANGRVRVFISWSDPDKTKIVSRRMAVKLHEWLPRVIQVLDPWMAEIDTDAGRHWDNEIHTQLQKCKIGIFCVTEDNLKSPWLNFEAGAISMKENALVIPYLFGIDPSRLVDPLKKFQACKVDEAGTKSLLKSINNILGELTIPDALLASSFSKWWPELEKELETIALRPEQYEKGKRIISFGYLPDPPTSRGWTASSPETIGAESEAFEIYSDDKFGPALNFKPKKYGYIDYKFPVGEIGAKRVSFTVKNEPKATIYARIRIRKENDVREMWMNIKEGSEQEMSIEKTQWEVEWLVYSKANELENGWVELKIEINEFLEKLFQRENVNKEEWKYDSLVAFRIRKGTVISRIQYS